MDAWLLQHQEVLQRNAYYGVIIVMALWEVVAPRRRLEHRVLVRWSGNFGITLINLLVSTWVVPLSGLALAFLAEERGWGLFNHLPAPEWLTFVVAFLALDLVSYVQHRIFHAVPLLWRIHLVHHADLDVDFTTGYRHHPFEAIINAAVYLATVAALGVPPGALLLHQALAHLSNIYTHGNIRAGNIADAILRAVIVTPDMHVVHHSAARAETDSNFGAVFSWWDRLFGTYCAFPAAGYQAMTIGLEYFRDPKDLRLERLLVLPFMRQALSPSMDTDRNASPPR